MHLNPTQMSVMEMKIEVTVQLIDDVCSDAFKVYLSSIFLKNKRVRAIEQTKVSFRYINSTDMYLIQTLNLKWRHISISDTAQFIF